ncbi:MAG: hypothetical protein ABSG99_05660 [Sedimentisphaerales bacterium]
MVLQYMLSDPGLANRETAKRETTEHETRAKPIITKRRSLICFLLLAYLIVAVVGYNLWVAEKNTPLWKLFTASVIDDLWTTRKSTPTKLGTVVGIIHSEENPCVLINHKLVHEGDITNGVKVVKIDRYEVEFERNGERWTQKVLAKPNPAWKTTKSPPG